MKIRRATILKTTQYPELHYLHRTNVIVEDTGNKTVTVHFAEGTVKSMIIPRLVLDFRATFGTKFNSYHYIYKDSNGKYNIATNPVFIAEHKNCIAVPKSRLIDIDIYLDELNNDIASRDKELNVIIE